MRKSLATIHGLIIDMDGVLWRGSQILPGVADFFGFMQRNSIRYLLATNNATRTVDFYVRRLGEIGISVEPAQVLTSANATALYLPHLIPPGSPVLVVGEAGLVQAVQDGGFQSVDPLDPDQDGVHPAAVVVGLDRQINYAKLRRAMSEIRTGARFVATNGDATFPSEDGLIPGAGSIVAAVQTASGRTPTVIGKPNKPMFDSALELLGLDRAETAMLGDRLDTDIEGGHAAGLATLLVMTGVTTPAELEVSPVKPDWVFQDLVELMQEWKDGG